MDRKPMCGPISTTTPTPHLSKPLIRQSKMSKREKASIKYWLAVLENRRLTLLSSVIKDDLANADLRSNFQVPALDRLSERFEKRLAFDDPLLPSKTITAFCTLNDFINSGEYCIDMDDEIVANARLFITRALENYTSKHVDEIQCNLDMTLLLSNWRYGPGASIGCEGTHFAQKIAQTEVSCTQGAAPYFKLLRRLNPICRDNDVTTGLTIEVVKGSSLGTVPKNRETHRTICTEPLGNMALQLAAGLYIEGALHCCGIDLATQPTINRRMACKGSLDGSLSTIDLKSASDLITPALIKLLWPTEWYHILMAFRSPAFKMPFCDVYLNANMMSTMGNGFTFPMMTLTLLSLIYGFNAKNKIGGVFHVDLTQHAVFGDDIICPSSSYAGICETLASAGLIVNLDKSYSNGPFRESCGGDYFSGGFITPFYIDHLLCDSDIYVALNKVLDWCSYHQVTLPETLKCLRKMLRITRPYLVPEWESPDSGLLTSGAPHRYKRLAPVKVQVGITDENLLMLSVLGGYVETRQDGSIVFTPRLSQGEQKYATENARYSKSYLDASDPALRAPKQSLHVNKLIALFM